MSMQRSFVPWGKTRFRMFKWKICLKHKDTGYRPFVPLRPKHFICHRVDTFESWLFNNLTRDLCFNFNFSGYKKMSKPDTEWWIRTLPTLVPPTKLQNITLHLRKGICLCISSKHLSLSGQIEIHTGGAYLRWRSSGLWNCDMKLTLQEWSGRGRGPMMHSWHSLSEDKGGPHQAELCWAFSRNLSSSVESECRFISWHEDAGGWVEGDRGF